MNDTHLSSGFEHTRLEAAPDPHVETDRNRAAEPAPPGPTKVGATRGRWLFGSGALALLVGGITFGASQSYTTYTQAMIAAEQRRDFVPTVRVAPVRAIDDTIMVSLPGTTAAFASANIYARTGGYIEKRNVDIGDHVKTGDVLTEITAPELDHQIAQAQATLAVNQAALRQSRASRDLAHVTNVRDTQLVKQGWVTLQQGDTDRLTLQAQEAAVGVAESNIAAQQALIRVLQQQKAYQSVVAPFDGVVTQRAVDIGSLVQASSTFLFTLMQTNVIRIYVYVPQDAAAGVVPGIEAVVRVPELPDHPFSGKVTRIAEALQPGTRTLLTEVDVPNPGGALSAGIYCTVELHIRRKAPSIIVSADAIIFNQNGLHVAVVENGVARLRKISIARDFGRDVEVSDGIKPGDRVIIRPPVDLMDGRKVQPQGAPA